MKALQIALIAFVLTISSVVYASDDEYNLAEREMMIETVTEGTNEYCVVTYHYGSYNYPSLRRTVSLDKPFQGLAPGERISTTFPQTGYIQWKLNIKNLGPVRFFKVFHIPPS